MHRTDKPSQWALVTGASSGLGREMAIQLARDYQVAPILVARRADRLARLQAELQEKFGMPSRSLAADLAIPDEVDRIFDFAVQQGDVRTVICNAGITYFGHHHRMDYRQFEQLLATNVTSIVRLTHLFVPHMMAGTDRGRILVVSSLAGLLPIPYQAAYSGSKAFLCNFGQALGHELRGTNISVTVFAPGGIETEMLDKSGLAAHFGNSILNHRPEACARSGLRAMWKGKPLHVPGVFNNLFLGFARFLPRSILVRALGDAYQAALQPKDRVPATQPKSIHAAR